MSITEERCITLHCDECGEGFGYEEGTVHHDVNDRVALRNDAADCDWGITDEGEWCPPCWSRKQCERFGHVPAIDVCGDNCDRCEEYLCKHCPHVAHNGMCGKGVNGDGRTFCACFGKPR